MQRRLNSLLFCSGAFFLALMACKEPVVECPPDMIDTGDGCAEPTPEPTPSQYVECGAGKWGVHDPSAIDFFVDSSFTGLGDGSKDAPYATIEDGLGRARALGGGTVLVAEGIYTTNISLSTGHDGVALVGRCRQLTRIIADDRSQPVLEFNGDSNSTVTVAGFTLSGGTPGLAVGAGTMELADIDITDSIDAGLLVSGGVVNGTNVWIRGVVATLSDQGGYGANVSGGTMTIVGGLVQNTEKAGFRVQGSVDLSDMEIASTGNAQQDSSPGLQIMSSGTGVCTNCSINSARGQAVNVQGNATLNSVTIENTLAGAFSERAIGVSVSGAGTLTYAGGSILGHPGIGLHLWGGGTANLSSVTIRDMSPLNDGTLGYGVYIEQGCDATIGNSTITNNIGTGVRVRGVGATATINGGQIGDTIIAPVGGGGIGLVVREGAQATVAGTQILNNEWMGIEVDNGSVVGTNVNVRANTYLGIRVTDGSIDLTSGALNDNQPDLVSIGGFGLFAQSVNSSSTVSLFGVTITNNQLGGVYFKGPGSYQVDSCVIDGDIGITVAGTHYNGNAIVGIDGIGAWNGSTGLAIRNNTLSATGAPSVVLDNSSARFESNTYTNPGPKILQQNCVATLPVVQVGDSGLVEACTTTVVDNYPL